jgi:hypothetical protein
MEQVNRSATSMRARAPAFMFLHLTPHPQTAVFTNAKAGMEGVNVDNVKRVVYEMSKDSAHFKNEQRKQEQTEEKIRRMKAQAQALTAADLQRHTADADAKLADLAASRDLTRTWLCVDMDAFFAAVEERNDPSLVRSYDYTPLKLQTYNYEATHHPPFTYATARKTVCGGWHRHDQHRQLRRSPLRRSQRHARLHRQEAMSHPHLCALPL